MIGGIMDLSNSPAATSRERGLSVSLALIIVLGVTAGD